jgi:D-alanine-D-alanine ligase
VPVNIDPREVSVLLLHNLDPSWTTREREEVLAATSQLEEALSAVGHPTTPLPLETEKIGEILRPYDSADHIVFNWCESIPGVPHSEPLVARNLEKRNFVFTGAGSASLALSADKYRVKRILEKKGLPTPEWRLYTEPRTDGWDIFPAIVKPANEHASQVITRDAVVKTEAELLNRIAYLVETYDQAALVEDFIDGREFHVSVWGNGRIEMLPPAEMDFSRFGDVEDRLCTYDSKFVPGSPHYENVKMVLPAPLAADELRTLEEICKAAYTALGCRDYGRIDLRLRDGVYYVLDVNPNADISRDASLALAGELAGYSYGEIGSRIILLAANRHPLWGKRR